MQTFSGGRGDGPNTGVAGNGTANGADRGLGKGAELTDGVTGTGADASCAPLEKETTETTGLLSPDEVRSPETNGTARKRPINKTNQMRILMPPTTRTCVDVVSRKKYKRVLGRINIGIKTYNTGKKTGYDYYGFQ
ncbi:MAG: hypothetical protein V1776_04795 [Candidatus Diapherotrites archaeon]